MASNKDEIEFLTYADYKEFVHNKLGTEQWVKVYGKEKSEGQNISYFCAFIPNDFARNSVKDFAWDLSIGHGIPGCNVSSDNDGNKVVEYDRFSDHDGIEPLVIVRNFHGVKEGYIEIIEEFRLFHNLYHDKEKNEYLKLKDNGDFYSVIKIAEDNTVLIRVKELRQYLAIRDMHLAIYFDNDRFSNLLLEDIPPEQEYTELIRDSICYFVSIGDWDGANGYSVFSRMLGKKLIPPLPKEKSEFYPYEEEKQYEDFIIGFDSDGDEVRYSCNPDELSNYFGANPAAPHFLTPVYFKPEVLSKYYSQPSKYSVEDNHLYCGGLWCLRMDNNNKDVVIVFLGDLGRDISYEEQTYWKSFNIPPEGKLSDVTHKRAFLGEFADPEKPDLYFKYVMEDFIKVWLDKFSWPLFKPLSKEDQHFYVGLRSPVSNEQSEFDSQILALTKILIDSLNEAEISKKLENLEADTKGISKFEKYLEANNFPETERCVKFLRNLQDLRSTGAAHRKSKKYQKIAAAMNLGERSFQDVFDELLGEATFLIQTLKSHFFD